MSFLNEGYEIPQSGGKYTKLAGTTTIRILSEAITGWLGWKDNKPIRTKTKEEFDGVALDEGRTPRHFWAFVVWNYETERVEVCEITQATIQKAIHGLVSSPKWGEPNGYDIEIIKTGEGKNTEYATNPSPPAPFPADLAAIVTATPINLEVLYEGGDPFSDDLPF